MLQLFVPHYNGTQYCSTEIVLLIFSFLQTNITSQMWPTGSQQTRHPDKPAGITGMRLFTECKTNSVQPVQIQKNYIKFWELISTNWRIFRYSRSYQLQLFSSKNLQELNRWLQSHLQQFPTNPVNFYVLSANQLICLIWDRILRYCCVTRINLEMAYRPTQRSRTTGL